LARGAAGALARGAAGALARGAAGALARGAAGALARGASTRGRVAGEASWWTGGGGTASNSGGPSNGGGPSNCGGEASNGSGATASSGGAALPADAKFLPEPAFAGLFAMHVPPGFPLRSLPVPGLVVTTVYHVATCNLTVGPVTRGVTQW